MTASDRPPPFGLALFLAPLIILGIHYGYEAYLADACLDDGGSFNYVEYSCSLSESFSATPYLHRNWGKALIAVGFSLSGLILLAINRRKRR
jgi:hypothetical protein